MNKVIDDVIAVAKTKAIADKIVKPIQSQLQKPTLAETQARNVPIMRFKKSVTQPVTPFELPKKPEVVNVQKPTATPTPISPALTGSPLVKPVAKDKKAVDVQEATKNFIKTDWGRVWDETVASWESNLNNLKGVVEGIKIQSIRDDQRIFAEAWKNPEYKDYYKSVLQNKVKSKETRAGYAEENRQIQTDLAKKYEGKEQSKFGTLAGQVSSGITQMIPMIVANAVVPGSGLPVMFAQVYESEYQSAKFDGASEEDAQVYGFFKGAIEAGTEYLFGGVPLMGEGLADTTGFKKWLAKGIGGVAEDSLMSMAQSELGKQFVSKAIDILGEGAEEYISEVLGSVAVKAYKQTDKGVLETLGESATSKEAWDAWFVGSITSAVMNLESYGIGKALQTTMKEKKMSALSQQEAFDLAKVIGEKMDTEVEWLETNDPNDPREGLYIPATDGQKAKIYLNPNSQKSVGTVAIHEIGHDLVAKNEGQDLVNEFLKTFYKSEELVDLYAKTSTKYQSAYNDQFIMKHSGLTQAQVDALDQTQYSSTLSQLQRQFKDLRQVEKSEILEEMFTKTLEKVIDSPAGMRRLVTGNLTVAQKIRRQLASLGASLAEDKKFFQLQEMEDLFNAYMEGYTNYVKMQKAQEKALQEEALAPKTELGRVLAKPVMASVQGKEKMSLSDASTRKTPDIDKVIKKNEAILLSSKNGNLYRIDNFNYDMGGGGYYVTVMDKYSSPMSHDYYDSIEELVKKIPVDSEIINTSSDERIRRNEERKAKNTQETYKLSKEQREYFKDSKVVDEKGNLLEVYHGSPTAGFMTFNGDLGDGNYKYSGNNVSFFTSNKIMAESYSASDNFVDTKKIESLEQANKYLKERKKHFGDNETYEIEVDKQDGVITILDSKGSDVLWYKNKADLFRNLKKDIANKTGFQDSGLYRVYLNIKNPLIVDADGALWSEIQYQGKEVTTNDLVKEALESNKYDGLIIKNVEDNGTYADDFEVGDVYVAFEPNQIKSVDNKKPTQDADIRYSLSDKEIDRDIEEIMKSQKDLGFDVKYSLKDAKEKNLVALHNLTEDKLMGLLDLGGIPVPSIAITTTDIGHENFGEITVVMKPSVVNPKKTPVFDRDAYSPRFPKIVNKMVDSETEKAKSLFYGLKAEAIKNGTYDPLDDKFRDNLGRLFDSLKDGIDLRKNKYEPVLLNVANLNYIQDYYEKETGDKLNFNSKSLFDKMDQKQKVVDFIIEKLEPAVGGKYIELKVDPFDKYGNRKPFSKTHIPYTLENVAKVMKGDILGEEGFYGQGTISALISKKFENLQDIRDSKDKLMTNEELKIWVDTLQQRLDILLSRTFNVDEDHIIDYLRTVGKNNINEKTINKYLKDNELETYFDDWAKDLIEYFEMLAEMPTQYFEAKPQRPVKFSEVETMLIPNDANPELFEKLDDMGIHYITYNYDDRSVIIKELDRAKFSLSDQIKFRKAEDYANIPSYDLSQSENLTKSEQKELEDLIFQDEQWGIFETSKEYERYNELVLKAKGQVAEKFKGLKAPKSKEEVYNDPNFKKYKEGKFDPKVMNNALELVKGYRGTEKRTKDQWLMVANQIGANLKTDDAEALKKYAVQTWYANNPNQKDRLNRQGTKFNPFFIHEWIAEVYKGAGVGTVAQVKQTQETQVNVPSEVKAVLEERGEPLTQMIEQLQSELPVEEEPVKPIEQEPEKEVEVVREEPTPEVAKLLEDIDEAERVRKHEQTIASTDAVTKQTKSEIEKGIDEGQFDYQVFSDKKAVRVADYNIKNDKNDALYNDFINKVDNNQKITKQDIANAEMLIVKYSKEKGQSDKVYNLVVSVAVVGTELGQAVQAMSLIRKMSGVGQYMALEKIANKLNKQYAEEYKDQIRRSKKVKGDQVIITIDPALRQKLIETPTDDVKGLQEASEAIKQNIANQMPSTTMDKITAWRYLSMLGNPRTHVRNLLGNALFVPLRIAKDGIGMVLERQLPVAERTKAIVPRSKNKAIFEFAENDYAENIETLQTGGKYNVSSEIERKKTIFKTKWLESARVKNFDFLEKEDAFFKKSAYVNAMAQFMKARNLTPATISQEQIAQARNHAYQVALKMTYQDASNLASVLNNLERSGGKFTKFAMSAVLPFKKTPINILKRGVEYSPVGLTLGLTIQMNEYRKGNITQAELIDSISAGMTGTGIALVGALMASMGLLNIDEDENKKKGAFDKAMGFQKYSINVLGQSFTIDWAVPAVMPLFVGASVFKQMDQEGLNLFDANVLKDAMTNVFNPAFEMSMLEGLTNTLMSYSSSGAEKVGDMITTMFTSYAGQFVPTVSGQIARIIDQSQRSTYAPSDSPITPVLETFLRRMANKIPLASMLNPKVINLRGEEVKQSDNLLIRAFNNLINPAYVASSKVNDTDKELIKLFDLTKDNDAIPKTASKSFVANGETYKLDSEAYSAFAKTMGTTSYDLLQKLTQSKAYEAMSNDERVTAVSRIYEYAQTKAKAEYLLSHGKRPSGKVFATYEKLKNAELHGVSVADYVVAKQIHDGLGDMTISKKQALIIRLVDKGYNYEKVLYLVNNMENYTMNENDKTLLKERIRARK